MLLLRRERLYSFLERHLQHPHIRVGGLDGAVALCIVNEIVTSWLFRMVVAVRLSVAVTGKELVSWLSEVVVVGVFEEVFWRHQGMVVEVDVFVRAWEICGSLGCVER